MSSLTFSLILLIVILIVHLVEEVKTDFRKRLPIGEIPQALFIGINLFIYLYCGVMLAFCLMSNPIVIPMAWIFAVAMLLNGMGHSAIMIFKKAYFPGGVSGLALVPAALNVIRALMVH